MLCLEARRKKSEHSCWFSRCDNSIFFHQPWRMRPPTTGEHGASGKSWGLGKADQFKCCFDAGHLATCSPWPSVNVKESTKSESGTRRTLSENRALWYFKIIYTHTKNAMSFLPKLRFKTLQYQSQTTKREAGASAAWRVGARRENTDTRVIPGPISSPMGHLWKPSASSYQFVLL